MRGAAGLVAAGLLSSFVGFASTFAVVLRGLVAVGASPQQAASGLMAVSVAMGLCGIALSLRTRMPITVAWSTPASALMATSGALPGGFGAAVGAFIVAALLTIVAGLVRPFGRWVARIPASLASAMLGGILLNLCLAPVQAVAELPWVGVPILVAWLLVGRVARLWAVPAALLTMLVASYLTAASPAVPAAALWPHPVLIVPRFSLGAAVGLGVPVFIVTMASQNIPGLTVMTVNGYRPSPGLLFSATGTASLLAAPFGSHAVNLAAITAAMCAGPQAHPDPRLRMWASVVCGVAYVTYGLLAGAATAYVGATPPVLIEAVAGLALLGTFGHAMLVALEHPAQREAAIIAFVAGASGVSILGIGGAFWGLLAGGAMLLLRR